jgi:hypothetical protein
VGVVERSLTRARETCNHDQQGFLFVQKISTEHAFVCLQACRAPLDLARNEGYRGSFARRHEDFRTLEIAQKAKRGELQDHMKTKNADSRHGRVVDLSEPLAAMLRDFVGGRTSGLVFCKPDGS